MDISRNPVIAAVFRHVLVVLSYALVAKLLLGVFATKQIVSIIWPSSGIALAALLLGGKKYIPAVAAGVFLGAIWTGNTVPVALGMTVGNTLEAVIAAWILSWQRIDIHLEKPRDYVWIAVAAGLASFVAAGAGAVVLWLNGFVPGEEVAANILIWWQGDVLGTILVTPLLLVWRTLPAGWLKKEHILETLMFFVLTFICGQIVFLGWFSDVVGELARFYWVFLFIAWASIRFGRHGVLLVILLTSIQCLLGILRKVGLVDPLVTVQQLQNYWFFMLVLAGIGLTLALVIFQRRNDEEALLSMKENAEKALCKLRESEDRYRILFEFSKDAMTTAEPPFTNITSGNREAIQLFGLKDEEELKCYGVLDFSPEFQPDGQKSVDKITQQSVELMAKGFLSFEWMHKRNDGKEFLCNIVSTVINHGGRLIVLSATRDITVQKQAEKSLREMNETLEQRVEQRTRELAMAKQMAESAASDKSEFLANMSHEIRIPISSVLGMSYLALKTDLNIKQRDYIEKIQLSAQHLLGLIDSILDFSKLEAGHVALESIDFSLDQVIDTLNTLVQDKASNKGLNLRVEIDNDVRNNLLGDPLRLAQILINYVNNAIKFTDHGDIVVHISNVEMTGRDAVMRFVVKDQGIGIPLQDQAHIFDSFRQGDISTTRKYGGTGLGLAISKQLAEMMGGEVGLSSAPGEGSIFWFTARLGRGNSERIIEHDNYTADKAGEYRKSMSGIRILLAEDNEINQQVACELLQLVGASVCVVGNGREALERLREEHFDCVLMDVQMPEMDGLETVRLIRADAALAHNIVIAMTANAWNQDRQQCMVAGMDDFISKPVKPSHLYATIAKWLKQEASPIVDVSMQQPRELVVAAKPLAMEELPPSLLDDPALIDLRVLAQSLGNNREQLREFVAGKFIGSTCKGVDEMQAALQAGDLALLKSLGHKFKSSAKTVGAMGFAELCLAMEKLPEGDYQPRARELIAGMQVLLSRIADAVKAV